MDAQPCIDKQNIGQLVFCIDVGAVAFTFQLFERTTNLAEYAANVCGIVALVHDHTNIIRL